MAGVIIGVDLHKLSATIEVVDHHGHLLGSGRYTTDKAGYAAMRTSRKPGHSGLGPSRAQTGQAAHWPSGWWRPASTCWTFRQAGRPGQALRHRPQPQDRRPGRALDRHGRPAHPRPSGAET